MRLSFLFTLVILLAAALLGWRQRDELAVARTTHARLADDASALGLELGDVATDRASTRASDRSRRQESKDAEVRAFARDLIAFAKELEARKDATGPQPEVDLTPRILALVDRMMNLDPAGIKTLISELRSSDIDPEMRDGILGFAVVSLSQSHPAAAVRLFTESADLLAKDGKVDNNVVRTCLGQWAAQDPAAALEWMEQNTTRHPELVTDQTKASLLGGIARQDPRLALQMLPELGVEDRQGAVREIIGAAKTPEERSAALDAIRESAAKPGGDREILQQALSRIAIDISGDGYAAASSWLASAALTPEEAAFFVAGLSPQATGADTGKWVEWMGGSLPADQLADPVKRVFSAWTARDYRAAGDWLNTAPDSPAKQAAVGAYASRVAAHDPASAAQWALTLPAGEARNGLLRQVQQQWQTQDPAAAEAFAQQHGIVAEPPINRERQSP